MACELIELLSADPHAKKMLADYHKAAVALHAPYAQYIAGRDLVLLSTLINTTDGINPFMRTAQYGYT